MTTLEARRLRAQRMMVDAGKALRATGETEYVGGVDVDTYADLFASLCKIQTRNLIAREAEVGGRTATSVRTELHLPASTAPLDVDDVWELTAVDALSLNYVGQRLRVLGPVSGSLKTARRYEVEEVVS